MEDFCRSKQDTFTAMAMPANVTQYLFDDLDRDNPGG
jgi:hypothetical protein